MTEKPLRILQVIESSSGGSGRHTLELTLELAKRGHQVDLVYSVAKIDDRFLAGLEVLKSMGVGTHHIEMPRRVDLGEFKAALKIRKLLSKQPNYDIMHLQSALAGAAGRMARLGKKQVTIYTPHLLRSAVPGTRRIEAMFTGSLERFLSAWTDRIILVSLFELDHALQHGLNPKKLALVENAAIEEPMGSREELRAELGVKSADTFVIGAVGRLTAQKDPLTLLRAIKHMKDHGCLNIKLALIGSGKLEPDCRAFCKENQIEDFVTFLGPVSGNYWMPAFDVLALPSASESWPYVMLEAATAGVPMVATKVGSVPQFVTDGVNGFTVEVGDHAAMAEALQKLDSSVELRKSMSEAMRLKSKDHTIDRMVTETLAVYYDALGLKAKTS